MKRKPETFAARLKRLRNIKGWSQQRLANEIGMSQAALSYLESERRCDRPSNFPKADTLAALATALGDGSLCIWDGVVW
jgi:transcriptional regulator with XRE-family HTH domain